MGARVRLLQPFTRQGDTEAMAGLLFVVTHRDPGHFVASDLLAVNFNDASIPELRSAGSRVARLCYYGCHIGESSLRSRN